MEELAQKIFKKIVRHLANHEEEISNISLYLDEIVEAFHNVYSGISQWETFSRTSKGESTIKTNTLFFHDYRIQLIHNHVFDLGSYGIVSVILIKDFPKPDLSIRKALFLYNLKTQILVKLDNEISRP